MNHSIYLTGALLFSLAVNSSHSAGTEDIVLADFEGPTYGDWKATGTAFGPGPARGTLPSQMAVSGFLGQGLVNSFYGGDQSTGKLISPDITLTRKYIVFLIGGGGWEGKTCMNLVVEGKTVRTAAGPNTQPGGSEELGPASWDVSEWAGKTAHLEIVDEATGGWGHINVDQIVLTDRKPPNLIIDAKRELKITRRFLNLPVRTGAPKKRMRMLVDGKSVREFDIELADFPEGGRGTGSLQGGEWWAFMDLVPLQGKVATLQVDKLREDSRALDAVEQSDEIKEAKDLYHERLRPQFHFTSRRGWNNDPNGLVCYQGEYHLFYQHNPYGWDWGNMHWGHAVSRDLVHWRELPEALYPDEHGTMFSGSAVVDWKNTSGLQQGKENTLICMFTAAGNPFTQGLAYSNDRGRSWMKFPGNPVLSHVAGENRDPKVFWYEPGEKWVMALYLDHDTYALFSSPNLKQWERLGDIPFPGTSECPEFFEIPLNGNPRDTRWVFYGGNGRYLVGRFDGRKFTTESGPHALNAGNCFYASQTYNDIPRADGRRILVPWGQMATPGMPFNQMIGLPVELTLHSAPDGLRLRANPVKELQSLRSHRHRISNRVLKPGENPLAGISAELAELRADFLAGSAAKVTFHVRGIPVVYDAARRELACQGKTAHLEPIDGIVSLHMLVDRTSIDIFGNDGRLYMPMGVLIPPENLSMSLQAEGGEARIQSLEVYALKSIWN